MAEWQSGRAEAAVRANETESSGEDCKELLLSLPEGASTPDDNTDQSIAWSADNVAES